MFCIKLSLYGINRSVVLENMKKDEKALNETEYHPFLVEILSEHEDKMKLASA